MPLTAKKREPKAPTPANLIAKDLAAEVVRLLSSRPEVITRRRDGAEQERATLHPGHIAVLVRANSHAVTVRDALHDAGVPAVIGGAGSSSGPARPGSGSGCSRPSSDQRHVTGRRRPRCTCFVGWTAEQVATASEDRWEDLHWSLHRWAALLRDQGVASLYETVSSSHGGARRVCWRVRPASAS